MKNLKTFTEFINESVEIVNEALSKDVISVLEEMELTLKVSMEDADDELLTVYKAIEKQLKAKSNKIYVVDEYAADEDDSIGELFSKLESKFKGKDLGISEDYEVTYSSSMNACKLVDNIDGMTAYYILDKSKI